MSDDNTTEPTMLTEPAQMRVFHLMQLRSAIGLELRGPSGMRFSNRGNPTAHAIKCGYTDYDKDNPPTITAKIKRAVYSQLDERIVAAGGQHRELA